MRLSVTKTRGQQRGYYDGGSFAQGSLYSISKMERKNCSCVPSALRAVPDSEVQTIIIQQKAQYADCHNAIFVPSCFDILTDYNDFLERVANT